MRKPHTLISCLLPIVAGINPASSAEINWITDITEITSVDDIDLTGTLAHAGSWGSGSSTVTAGAESIIFDDVDNANATATQNGEVAIPEQFAEPLGFDPDFLVAMDSFAYDGDNPKVITLNGLTAGNIYQVQLFASDDRTCCSGRTQLWSDNASPGGGNETGTFSHGDSPYVIGRFVADGTSQSIYGHGVAQTQTIVNGYVLRDIGPNIDSDNDGVPDGLDDEPANPDNDSDADGLGNADETNNHGTNPLDSDSDDDGLSDGDEVNIHTTNPNNPDHDSDGFGDGFEVNNAASGFDPLVDDSAEDPDSDGLINSDEIIYGTDVLDDDTDDDGTIDGDEVGGLVNPYTGGVLGATPGDPTDPNNGDSDNDGLLDSDETGSANGFVTDPNTSDTDGDGFGDGFEISEGTDPLDDQDSPNVPTPVATMTWNAAFDLDGDNLWPTLEVPEIAGIAWDFGAPKAVVTGVSNFAGVTAWYNSPSATMESFNDAPLSAAPFSQSTNQPVSFELIFRPGDLLGNHLLFETGGNGDGTGIVLNGDTLEYRAQDANTVEQRIILSHTFAPGDEADFQHVVGTIQNGAAGTNEGVLYVNGVEVDRFAATGAVNDWAGGDDSGLGRLVGSTSAGLTGFAAFTGDVSMLRYYAQTVLSPSEVRVLYDGLNVNPDTDNDGLLDSWEEFHFSDLDEVPTGDPDLDGLDNLGEFSAGTSPVIDDDDADGINDGDELSGAANPYTGGSLGGLPGDPTSPTNSDSDGDGINDGEEVDNANGSVTDPNNPDTDSDGVRDSIEINLGTDPTNPSSFPPSTAVLTHHYTFDVDASDSVGSIDGSLEGGASIVAGTIGNALDVNGGIQHALMTNPGFNGDTAVIPTGTSFSVSLWAKRDSSSVNGWLIGQGDSAVADQSLHIGFRNNNQIAHAFWGDDLQTNAATQVTDTVDWHHWVFTYDADINEQAIYVDGGGAGNVFYRISTGDFIGSGTNNFWVGQRRDGQNFDGQIDDVQVYDGVLSGADVMTLFNTPGSTIGGPNQGITVTDISYDGSHVTLTWTSIDNATYSVNYSTNLESFDDVQNSSYSSQGATTTYRFINPDPGALRLFFKVTRN